MQEAQIIYVENFCIALTHIANIGFSIFGVPIWNLEALFSWKHCIFIIMGANLHTMQMRPRLYVHGNSCIALTDIVNIDFNTFGVPVLIPEAFFSWKHCIFIIRPMGANLHIMQMRPRLCTCHGECLHRTNWHYKHRFQHFRCSNLKPRSIVFMETLYFYHNGS